MFAVLKQQIPSLTIANVTLANAVKLALGDVGSASESRNVWLRSEKRNFDAFRGMDGISFLSFTDALKICLPHLPCSFGWKVKFSGACPWCDVSKSWTEQYPCSETTAKDGKIFPISIGQSYKCDKGHGCPALAKKVRPPIVFFVNLIADGDDKKRHRYYAMGSYKAFAIIYLNTKTGLHMVKTVKTELNGRHWVLFDGSSNCKNFYASEWEYFDVNIESDDSPLSPVAMGVIYDGNWDEKNFHSL